MWQGIFDDHSVLTISTTAPPSADGGDAEVTLLEWQRTGSYPLRVGSTPELDLHRVREHLVSSGAVEVTGPPDRVEVYPEGTVI